MKNITIGDAVRTIGHLLEHHMTTKTCARNSKGFAVEYNAPDATSWCLVGAHYFVNKKMFNQDLEWYLIQDITGIPDGTTFDNLSPEKRLEVAKKLQAYSVA
jgi:hypothetical protein